MIYPPVEGGDQYVQGNLFDEAIWNSLGDGKSVAKHIHNNMAPLLGANFAADTIQDLLTQHGAACKRGLGIVICRYSKKRVRGKMADILTRYEIEVIARTRQPTGVVLAVCVDGDVARVCIENERK